MSIAVPRAGGPLPLLVAEYADGRTFELPFVYLSGLELSGTASGPRMAESLISIECPAPFWTARDALSFSVANESSGVGLLPNLAQLPVSRSAAIGSITLENPGDVDSDISWTITGPGGPTPISINGVGFVFEAVLQSGEVITIVRTPTGVKVLDQAGANRYADLGPAPKFPRLPAGISVVDIEMANASPGGWEPTTDIIQTNRVTSPSLRVSAEGWQAFGAGLARTATGFYGSDAGFLALTWAAASTPEAAVQVQVPAAVGDVLSASLSVLSSVAQTVRVMTQFVDYAGAPVGPLTLGGSVELPANTPVVVGVDSTDLDPAPEGTVGFRFMASVDVVGGRSWAVGDTFAASLGIVTASPARTVFFDGSFEGAGWAGTADASESVLFDRVRVNQSTVQGFYKPRREVVY
ncbi:phage tail family protein [Cryobacterium sp. Hh7]|uniref:phage tail family protein n=1 Tax=Cryobacterium sp. Hh7 TaxID=1259159 RepID=UPI001F545AC1|nr:phage tail family protein [Cryobacterium sp. Hh7]